MKHVFIVIALFMAFNTSASQNSLSLKDALDAALERSKSTLNVSGNLDIEESDYTRWLDGVPTVSASLMKSQEQQGADEAELGIAFPIKSRLRRNIEQQLSSNVLATKETAQRQLSLYLSGMLRELVWNYHIVNVNIDSATQKKAMLDTLMTRFQDLAESRAIPQYVSLLIEKEDIDNDILLLEQKANIRNIQAQFYALTGLIDIPSDTSESLLTNINGLTNHPDIAALDSAWQYFSGSLTAINNKAQPWNVQLRAKRVEEQNFSENQIGIGIEVPISLGNDYSALQSAEYTKTKSEYEVERHQLMTNLQLALEQTSLNLKYLEQKQALLDKSISPIQKLEQIIPELLKSNLDNKEVLVRHALEVIEARANITANRLAIKKQISMLRQAAGISL